MHENITYILEMSHGKTLNLFYNEGSGICMSSLGRKNKWIAPQVLISKSSPWFSACLDSFDGIHILHQDSRGDLYYRNYKNGVWKKESLLKSKQTTYYNKHPYIINKQNTIYLFYVIKYNGKNLLSIQSFQEGRLSEPFVLDYIEPDNVPFLVYSEDETLSVCYKRVSQKETGLGFRQASVKDLKWGSFLQLSDSHSGYHLQSFALSRGFAHLCVQKNDPLEYILLSIRQNIKTHELSEAKKTDSSNTPFEYADLLSGNGRLYCIWPKDGEINYQESFNEGESWSDSVKYEYPSHSYRHTVLCTNKKNPFHNACGLIPYKFSSLCKPALLIDEIAENSPGETAPEKQETELANKIMGIEKTLSGLKTKLEEFEGILKKYALAIEKMGVRLQINENDISGIKKNFSADERHPASIKGFKSVTPEYLKSYVPLTDESINCRNEESAKCNGNDEICLENEIKREEIKREENNFNYEPST